MRRKRYFLNFVFRLLVMYLLVIYLLCPLDKTLPHVRKTNPKHKEINHFLRHCFLKICFQKAEKGGEDYRTTCLKTSFMKYIGKHQCNTFSMLTCATSKFALWDIPLYYDKGSNILIQQVSLRKPS